MSKCDIHVFTEVSQASHNVKPVKLGECTESSLGGIVNQIFILR